jgi:hypothetical protein
LEAREGEGGVAIGLDLGIDVRATVEQQPHRRRVAVHGCQHQWGNAQFGAGTGVYLRLCRSNTTSKLVY